LSGLDATSTTVMSWRVWGVGGSGEMHPSDQGLAHSVASTRGHPDDVALEVLLDPEELDALLRIAARREVPASTLAREALLRLIRG